MVLSWYTMVIPWCFSGRANLSIGMIGVSDYSGVSDYWCDTSATPVISACWKMMHCDMQNSGARDSNPRSERVRRTILRTWCRPYQPWSVQTSMNCHRSLSACCDICSITVKLLIISFIILSKLVVRMVSNCKLV